MVRTPRLAATLPFALVLLAGCTGEDTPTATTTTPSTSAVTASPTSTTRTTTNTTAPETGRPGVPTGAAGRPRGGVVDPDDVDTAQASDVARAYARTTWTADTRLDNSWTDAQRRATRWLTPELADALTDELPAGPGWDDLDARDAWTTAKATDVSPDAAAPTGLTASRVIDVVVTTKTGAGRAYGRPQTVTMLIDLTRRTSTAPWRVSNVTTY